MLVTGATGFIGGHVARTLAAAGFPLRVTVRNRHQGETVRAALAPHVRSDRRVDDAVEVAVASLDHDAGWLDAARGCRFVQHLAMPVPIAQPREPAAMVATATGGMRRIVEAAAGAGVERMVVTSSLAAVSGSRAADRATPVDERDWTDPDRPGLVAYYRAKTLAEQTAWALAEATGLSVAVINPGLVLGPLLYHRLCSSVEIIRRPLAGGVPLIPRLGVETADVRDVADLHVAAMTSASADGERFLATAGFLEMVEAARWLRTDLGHAARRVPTRTAPDWTVRALAVFRRDVRLALPQLGARNEASSDKARTVLGWQPRPLRDTVVATAHSLLERNLVRAAPRRLRRRTSRRRRSPAGGSSPA